MTTPLSIHSERYAATGNIASQGVANQLGRPKLDGLAVLVREAVQNCWDARLSDQGVRVDFHLVHLDLEARTAWRTLLFAHDVEKLGVTARLMANEPVRVLYISDRGTSGLGGPTRADRVAHPGEARDFVDFLRNVGQPPDKQMGGGTYGFGKAALYAPSGCHTIVVYTRCRIRSTGQTESRLIGAALGGQYQTSEAMFTGRHWWGYLQDGVAEPALNADADALAKALGMPGFEGDDTGTTIAIVDFQTGTAQDADEKVPSSRSADDAADAIGQALLWNFWPKMVPRADGEPPPMRFSVRVDGVVRGVPDPTSDPGLAAMVEALKLARSPATTEAGATGFATVTPIRYKRKLVGRLVMYRFMPATGARFAGSPAFGAPDEPIGHHVAWMRSAELVVRYEVGEAFPTNQLAWAAVFVVERNADIDKAFSDSEPPTHDDWAYQNVADPDRRNLVRRALASLRAAVREAVQPNVQNPVAADDRKSLAGIATSLGAVLAGVPGGAAGFHLDKPQVASNGVARLSQSDDDWDDATDEQPRAKGSSAVAGGGEASGGGSAAGDAQGAGAHASLELGADPHVLPDGRIGPLPPLRSRPGKPRLRTADPSLELVDGIAVFRLQLKVKHGANTTGTRLRARVQIQLQGENVVEHDAPEGASQPRVHAWRGPTGRVVFDVNSIDSLADEEGQWTLDVALPDEAQIKVEVEADAILARVQP